MNEVPENRMDNETKERMKEAWSGLAQGYLTHTRRVGVSTTNPIFALPLEWRENSFKVNVFGFSYAPTAGKLPTNLQMLLMQANNIQLVSGARLEWEDLKPTVLDCFGFNMFGPDITPEQYINLINTVGAHLEQPHNTI